MEPRCGWYWAKVPREFVGSGPEVDMLSDRLMTAWLSFARSANPSQPGLEWLSYDARHAADDDLRCALQSG